MSLETFLQPQEEVRISDAELERCTAFLTSLRWKNLLRHRPDLSLPPYSRRPREFKTVTVHFEVHVDTELPPGIELGILGDRPALREWNKDDARPLVRCGGENPMYRGSVDLAVGHHATQYKIVAVVKIEGRCEVVAFEEGENRKLDLYEDQTARLHAAANNRNGPIADLENSNVALNLRDWDRPVGSSGPVNVTFEAVHPRVPFAKVVAVGNGAGSAIGMWPTPPAFGHPLKKTPQQCLPIPSLSCQANSNSSLLWFPTRNSVK